MNKLSRSIDRSIDYFRLLTGFNHSSVLNAMPSNTASKIQLCSMFDFNSNKSARNKNKVMEFSLVFMFKL